MRLRQLAPVIAGLIALAGCAEKVVDPSTLDKTNARLRLVHATPGLGAIDVELAGIPVIRGIVSGTTSPVVLVGSGNQQLVIKVNGTVLGTVTGALTNARLNSLVVSGGAGQLSSVVESDTGTVNVARANIRMIVVATANTAAPIQLQALAQAPGLPTDSIMKFGIDATVSRYSSLLYFNPGQFTFRYVAAGTTSPVLAEVQFTVAAGETKAIVLSREIGGAYRAEVVVEE